MLSCGNSLRHSTSRKIRYFGFQFCKLNYLNDIRNYIAFWMRLRLSSDSSFLLSTYVFAMAAAANLYFYFWYQQLKLIYVAFLRQDHRAKCETISLFPLTTNNSIAEKGFLSSVKHIPYPSALLFWHSLDVHDFFPSLKYLVWKSEVYFKLEFLRLQQAEIPSSN